MGSPIGYLANNNNLNNFARSLGLNRNSNDYSDEGLEIDPNFLNLSFDVIWNKNNTIFFQFDSH